MIKQRNLDGVYFRMKRGERYKPVCFTDLTPDERNEILSGRSEEWLKNMCCILADTVRRIADQFDISAVIDDDEEE